MLIRYWFVIYPEDKYGPRNIGVTAHSLKEAKFLICDTLARFNWSHITENCIANADVIEEIDIRLLDKGHVIPNMGIVVFKGVWFPFCNL